MLSKLTLRSQVFDYGVFPTPPTLNTQTLISLYNPLLLSSNSDKKISLEKFKEIIAKHCTYMTPVDGEVYFMLFKVLTEDDLSFLAQRSTAQSKQMKENPLFPGKAIGVTGTGGLMADFRGLMIFMFLQTFSTSLRYNLDQKQKEFNAQWEPNVFGHFNEGIRGNASASHLLSQLNSPRSQAIRLPLGSEYVQTIQFLRTNIKQILRLLIGDLASRENPHAGVSAVEFNILQFLFKDDKSTGAFLDYPLSECTGLFTGPKAPINSIADWISGNVALADSGDVFLIQNMNRSVTVKDKQTCDNKEVRIMGCEDSYIYIDACVKYISIVNCINTSVFVGSVQRVCTVDKCENLTITVAANILRIGNTIDSTVNYYGSFNPILYGDNRSITVGPYNANYMELPERIREAEIPVLARNIDYYAEPLVLNALENSGINYKVQKVEDYINLALPDSFQPISGNIIRNLDPVFFGLHEKQQGKNGYAGGSVQEQEIALYPLLCPNTFRDELKRRHNSYKDIQEDVKQIGVDAEGQKLMHFCIQSYFKEWLVHSGSLKPILEMTKMITKDT